MRSGNAHTGGGMGDWDWRAERVDIYTSGQGGLGGGTSRGFQVARNLRKI